MYCEKYTVDDVLQQNIGFTPRSTVVRGNLFGLSTLSTVDEHTTSHQKNLRLSIRVFMTRGGAIVFGGVHVWKLNGLVSLALATWPP
jgi:hypothetical protein